MKGELEANDLINSKGFFSEKLAKATQNKYIDGELLKQLESYFDTLDLLNSQYHFELNSIVSKLKINNRLE